MINVLYSQVKNEYFWLGFRSLYIPDVNKDQSDVNVAIFMLIQLQI